MSDDSTTDDGIAARAGERLEGLAGTIQSAVGGAIGAPADGRLADALHGTWLGHPLHPALSDVPIGGWCAAVALDVAAARPSALRGIESAARLATGVGIVGALVAAAAGAADWGRAGLAGRRRGLLHATTNVVATLTFAASLAVRGRAARRLRRAGFATVLVGGWLGGSLVFEEGLGVDHARDVSPPDDFTPVAGSSELPEGRLLRVEAEGAPIVLLRREGRVLALAATCSHYGGPLDEGDVDGTVVTCPWHGSRFSMEDGTVCGGPAVFPQPCLEARERDGRIEVRA